MEMRQVATFVFLALVLEASQAAVTPESYWKARLPNTPMPKAVAELLPKDLEENKQVGVGVGKGGVNVDANGGKVGGDTNVGVGKGGVAVHTGHKGKPVFVNVQPGPSPFLYKYAATETQLHDNPNVALFFFQEDLKPAKTMNLHFVRTAGGATFLPRQVAQSIPFSSRKMPEILRRFSVNSESEEAKIMSNTIKECESKGTKGEDKTCATSLEGMVDFSISKLGKELKAISTRVEKYTRVEQKYRIAEGVRKMGRGSKLVACHKQSYPYAVFYCHEDENAEAHVVPLNGADGSKATAVAVCHKDTSEWNPKHLAFQVLKVKPGTVPVCHFLPEDNIVWVRN